MTQSIPCHEQKSQDKQSVSCLHLTFDPRLYEDDPGYHDGMDEGLTMVERSVCYRNIDLALALVLPKEDKVLRLASPGFI